MIGKTIVCNFETFEIAHIKNTTLRIVEETVISETIRRVLYFLSWRNFIVEKLTNYISTARIDITLRY